MSKVYVLNPDGTISVSVETTFEIAGPAIAGVSGDITELGTPTTISEGKIGDEKLFNIIENDKIQSAKDALDNVVNINGSNKDAPEQPDLEMLMSPLDVNAIESVTDFLSNNTSITKIKNNSLKNSSHDFDLPDGSTVLQGKSVETILNFNSIGGDENVFASEFEMAGGIPSPGQRIFEESAKKITLGLKILIDALIHITAAEIIFTLNNSLGETGGQDVEENFKLTFGENSNIDWFSFSSFLFKRLNYPRYKSRSFTDVDERISAFIIGFIEIIRGDNFIDFNKYGNLDFRKKYQRDISDKYGITLDIGDGLGISTVVGASLFYLFDILATLTPASINRLLLLERKISHQKHWFNKLYDAKTTEKALFDIDRYMKTLDYYFFKFVIERMHVGLKIIKYYEYSKTTDSHVTYESSINRVGLSKSGYKTNSNVYRKEDNYLWQLEESGTSLSQATRVRALPQSLLMTKELASLFGSTLSGVNNEISSTLLQNFAIKTGDKKEGQVNRLSPKLVKDMEEYLNSEYMPFYFHDLRTNEIISFHAFVDNISDSFQPDYSQTSGFGRVDDIRTYVKTTRNISLSFTIASTSIEDHELMWYQINKLVSMCYPQYSRGSPNTRLSKNKDLTYPYTQVPTNSPMIRLRVGDVIKSNYSRKNLARKFGVDKLYANKTKISDIVSKQAIDKEKIFKEDPRTFKGGKNTTLALGNNREYLKQFDTNSNYLTIKNDILEDPEYLKEISRNVLIPNSDQSSRYYLMPGLYLTVKNPSNSFTAAFDAIGLTGGGKEYVHIKEYELIDLEQSDEIDNSDFKLELVLANEKYGGITFMCDGYSVVKKNLYDKSDRIGTLRYGKKGQITAKGKGHYTVKKNNKTIRVPDPDPDRIYKLSYPIEDKKYNTDRMFTFNNPILDAHESSKGEGLAGFITNLDINYNEQLWETSKTGSKAPHAVKITISYSPIHDIPLGLDREGMMTAPAYNVGDLNKSIFSTVYDETYQNEYFEYIKKLEAIRAEVTKDRSDFVSTAGPISTGVPESRAIVSFGEAEIVNVDGSSAMIVSNQSKKPFTEAQYNSINEAGDLGRLSRLNTGKSIAQLRTLLEEERKESMEPFTPFDASPYEDSPEWKNKQVEASRPREKILPADFYSPMTPDVGRIIDSEGKVRSVPGKVTPYK